MRRLGRIGNAGHGALDAGFFRRKSLGGVPDVLDEPRKLILRALRAADAVFYGIHVGGDFIARGRERICVRSDSLVSCTKGKTLVNIGFASFIGEILDRLAQIGPELLVLLRIVRERGPVL